MNTTKTTSLVFTSTNNRTSPTLLQVTRVEGGGGVGNPPTLNGTRLRERKVGLSHPENTQCPNKSNILNVQRMFVQVTSHTGSVPVCRRENHVHLNTQTTQTNPRLVHTHPRLVHTHPHIVRIHHHLLVSTQRKVGRCLPSFVSLPNTPFIHTLGG